MPWTHSLAFFFLTQIRRLNFLGTWLDIMSAALCPLVCFLQCHLMQHNMNFLGRLLCKPFSICANAQHSGGLANATKSLHLSNERVKFQFWVNYLFEASPASLKWFWGHRRQLHFHIWISAGNTNSGALASSTELQELSAWPFNWPYVALQTQATADEHSNGAASIMQP